MARRYWAINTDWNAANVRARKVIKAALRHSAKLLSSEYKHQEVRVTSSDVDRILMSAETQLNGLYPPRGRQIWRHNLDWQPIPVHTVPSAGDHLHRPIVKSCPRFDLLERFSHALPEYQKIDQEAKRFFKWLAPFAGKLYDLSTDIISFSVYDAMRVDLLHNLPLPSWASKFVVEKLEEIATFQFNWYLKGRPKQRLLGGPLVGDIVKNMKGYKEDPSKVKKMYIYSGHADTLAAPMAALGLYYDIIPPYCSALMFELYGYDDGSDLSVRIYYRFGKENYLRQLKLPGCTLDCPLDKFISQTAAVIPQDSDAECK